MKIAVIGTGYVGLVSATCFAHWGHDVVAVDKDATKISGLKKGRLPFYEPGLETLIEENVRVGRLSFNTDLSHAVRDADVVFLAVGTPSRPQDGEADLSFVYAAAKEVGEAISGFTVIATKSTVPVGTGDEIERIVQRVARPNSFAVVSNPEFLREGTAVDDFLRPDRVVVGTANPAAKEVMISVYRPLERANSKLMLTTRRTAELIKYAANAFLALRISFINEMADLCEKTGADICDVSLGMGLDSRIGTRFLAAGPGYGGSCFPKDTLALLRTSQEYGVPLRLVQETVSVNESRKRRMALKVAEILGGDVEGKTIAILGLTFKADTDDVRDTPAVPLIEALQRAGAKIRAYDPQGIENARKLLSDVEFSDDPYECATRCDAAVLVTDWDCLRNLELARLGRVMRARLLVDLRNVVDPQNALRNGFSLTSIGRARRDDIANANLIVMADAAGRGVMPMPLHMKPEPSAA